MIAKDSLQLEWLQKVSAENRISPVLEYFHSIIGERRLHPDRMSASIARVPSLENSNDHLPFVCAQVLGFIDI
jgi:hypothetical protein